MLRGPKFGGAVPYSCSYTPFQQTIIKPYEAKNEAALYKQDLEDRALK
jgi:hypothetical protein